jgi:hypothetical protein
MMQENNLEKKQIEQLILKIKEKDNIQNELEREICETCETLDFLKMKLKVIFLKIYFKFLINLFRK